MPTWSSCFSVGDRARLSFAVNTTAAAPINTTVMVVVNAPSGAKRTVVTGSTGLTNDGVGRWHTDYPCAEAGRHTYFMRSTGAVNASTSGAFAVRPVAATT